MKYLLVHVVSPVIPNNKKKHTQGSRRVTSQAPAATLAAPAVVAASAAADTGGGDRILKFAVLGAPCSLACLSWGARRENYLCNSHDTT